MPLAADHELASGSNLVFVPAAEAIHALDVATGRELWLAPTGTITAPLLVRTGWLIAISGEKRLRSLPDVPTFTQGGLLRFVDPRTFGEMFVTKFDDLDEQVTSFLANLAGPASRAKGAAS